MIETLSLDDLAPLTINLCCESDPGSDLNITPEHEDDVIQRAIADGFTIIRGDNQTILLDLDNAAALATYELMLPRMQSQLTIVEVERWYSKSGGLHVKLEIDQCLPMLEIILLQACLGSDRTREFLSMLKLDNGIAQPSLLFRPSQSRLFLPHTKVCISKTNQQSVQNTRTVSATPRVAVKTVIDIPDTVMSIQ